MHLLLCFVLALQGIPDARPTFSFRPNSASKGAVFALKSECVSPLTLSAISFRSFGCRNVPIERNVAVAFSSIRDIYEIFESSKSLLSQSILKAKKHGGLELLSAVSKFF